MRRGWTTIAVFVGFVSGCQCVQLPTDVLFRCANDTPVCPDDSFCGSDGYCHPLQTSDSGFPCNAPPDAGFLFEANVCTPSGFCWQNPLPVGSDLDDVTGSGSGAVYFGGAGGLVMKFENHAFSALSLPATQRNEVASLWSPGDATLYALARQGVVLYYPGSGDMTVFSNSLGEDCVSLAGWTNERLWAGSTNAYIWQLEQVNPQWTRAANFGGGGVWMNELLPVSGTEVWGVGNQSLVGVHNQVTPTTWGTIGGAEFDDAGRPDLYAIAQVDDGFLVGGEQGFLGHVSTERDGGSITALISTNVRLRDALKPTIHDFWKSPDGTIWAVGSTGSTAWRDGDGGWTEEDIPDSGTLYAAWGADDGEPWAVGSRGTLKRRACGAWQNVDYRATTRHLYGAFHTKDAAWAVGEFGSVIKRTNGRWEPTAANRFPVTTTLYSVWGSSDSDVVVAGQDGLLNSFDGTSWDAVKITMSNPPTWNRVRARNVNDVWVVGRNGYFMRRKSGTWEQPVQMSNYNFVTLNDVAFGPGASEVWVVGDTNVKVLHSDDDGATWDQVDNGLPGFWPGGIAVTDDGAVWLGGGSYDVYRLPPGGTDWAPVQLGTNNNQQAYVLCAMPGGKVYVAGQNGLLATASSDGGSSSSELLVSFTNRDFEDIVCDGEAGVMAVGDNGQVLVHAP